MKNGEELVVVETKKADDPKNGRWWFLVCVDRKEQHEYCFDTEAARDKCHDDFLAMSRQFPGTVNLGLKPQ